MKHEPPAEHRLCHPGKDGDNIKLDPEFQGLIPPLSAGELAGLHRSLDDEGCRDPLVVWKGQDTLVDGHNRIAYCREKGYPFPVTDREFADRDAVKAYIIHAQLGRRNLSRLAESYLHGRRYLELRHQGLASESASGQSDPKRTSEQLAEEFKVGEKTIRRDGNLAEAVDQITANCGPDAKNLVLSRETGFTRGGVLRLAGLKPEEQKKFLKELKESGKRPRKPRKGKRRQTITLPSQPKALAQALLKQLGADEVAEVARALAEAMQASAVEGSQEHQAEHAPKRRPKKAR